MAEYLDYYYRLHSSFGYRTPLETELQLPLQSTLVRCQLAPDYPTINEKFNPKTCLERVLPSNQTDAPRSSKGISFLICLQQFAYEGYADAKPGGNWVLSRPRLGAGLRNALP